MGKLVQTDAEQERKYLRKAKQYERVKWIIIITSLVLAVFIGIIVVGNGKIFKLFGIERYYEGLNVFIMGVYILIMIGVVFFLCMIISFIIRSIIEFIKDTIFRR